MRRDKTYPADWTAKGTERVPPPTMDDTRAKMEALTEVLGVLLAGLTTSIQEGEAGLDPGTGARFSRSQEDSVGSLEKMTLSTATPSRSSQSLGDTSPSLMRGC